MNENKEEKIFSLVKEIIKFSPRQLEGEKETAKFLKNILTKNKVDFVSQKYKVFIPKYKKAELIADGEKIECSPCGFKSGKIEGKEKLLNPLFDSDQFRFEANISFNPVCEEGISTPDHFFAPAVAVNKKDLGKILEAKEVVGGVDVEKVEHDSENILVGNLENPKKIVFAHYDSLKTGAIDNGSGVAVMMTLILENKELLEENLFIFSGNEEISYDEEFYWGYGFRVFEKEYFDLMNNAKKIIPIDSVGNGKNEVITDEYTLSLGFPIKHFKEWKNKIKFIAGDYDHLMTVYHSESDDGRGMSEESLQEAKEKLKSEIL